MLKIGDKVKIKWGHEVDGKYTRRYTVVKNENYIYLNRYGGSAFRGECLNIGELEDEIYRMMDKGNMIWIKVGDV